MNGAATNKSRTRVLIVVDCISRAQTLRPALMKIPDGANNRITIKTIIPTASLYAVEIKTPENVSMRPNAIPPTMAPVKLPRPPSVARHDARHNECVSSGFFHADAHQLCGFGVLRRGLHRNAETGIAKEQLQRRHHH